MRTVDHDADATGEQGRFEALPARVQETLGELAGAAKEGLLALSVGVGLGVLAELMAEEVDEVVGPKGRPERAPEPLGGSRPSAAVNITEAAERFVSKLFPCSTKLLRSEPLRAMVIGAFVRTDIADLGSQRQTEQVAVMGTSP